EHLREMDELRRSVQNASIEQKDPLLIYKLESFDLFKAMIDRINGEVIGFLAKAGLPSAQPNVQEARTPSAPAQQRLRTSRTESPQYAGARSSTASPRPTAGPAVPGRGAMPPQGPRQPIAPVRVEKKVGRNDPCPCGSGRKYKQCHGKEA
ncbi:MAG: SEC-C domain-containing protein, partial [Flavobacteriales bacterium]|nr:SEC-C domain-containing protein [Flavobacteriales bacterium]